MSQLVPPMCLLLGLAMLVAGFALMAVEPPPEPMELHQARVTGDDKFRDVLEGNVAPPSVSPGSCSSVASSAAAA